MADDLRALEELYTAGFVQSTEYERRKAELVATMPRPSPAPTKVSQPQPRPTAAATPSPTPKAPAKVLGKFENPHVWTTDYSKYLTSPITYTVLKGWKKEPNNYGQPDNPTESIKATWQGLLDQYAAKIQLKHTADWNITPNDPKCIRLIGGFDISFARGNKIDAVVCLTVCHYPSQKLVFEAYKMIKLKAPYIPGLLNFREVPFYEDILEDVRQAHPEFLPQLLMLDGNGVIHPKGCGVASQLGVLTGIPCLGVAKKLLVIDNLNPDSIESSFRSSRDKQLINLVGHSGKLHGYAYRKSPSSDIVYISAGHGLDQKLAIDISMKCSVGKSQPEPVNQSDLLGREWLAKNYDSL